MGRRLIANERRWRSRDVLRLVVLYRLFLEGLREARTRTILYFRLLTLAVELDLSGVFDELKLGDRSSCRFVCAVPQKVSFKRLLLDKVVRFSRAQRWVRILVLHVGARNYDPQIFNHSFAHDLVPGLRCLFGLVVVLLRGNRD